MEVNGKKFDHLPIGPHRDTTYYTLDGQEIVTKEHVKDLGIQMSSTLKFDYHIINMVGKADILSAWILRTFRTRDTYSLKTLLKSLLVPTAEYGSVLWSPDSQGLINLIESVQRKFTSRFAEFNELDPETGLNKCVMQYWDRLKVLRVYSLERRRERYIIIFMHKIILGIYPNPGFDPKDIAYDDRFESILIRPKHCPTAKPWVQQIRYASFFHKGPKLYQTILPKIGGVQNILEPNKTNIDKFKEKLDDLLEFIPDEPGEKGCRNATTNSILDQIHHLQEGPRRPKPKKKHLENQPNQPANPNKRQKRRSHATNLPNCL